MKQTISLAEAVKERHSVRQYTEQPIDAEAVTALRNKIDALNTESGLHLQLVGRKRTQRFRFVYGALR